MKITIEVSDKEYISAMRKGWNDEFEESLGEEAFSLPPTGDMTDLPYQDDVMRAIPYLSKAKFIRVS